MDDRTQPADMGRRPSDEREPQEAPPARRAFIEPLQEPRTAQPALASDGQVVEAGYGHGV